MNSFTNKTIASFAAVAAIGFLTGLPTAAVAETWEMRTDPYEAPGTRALESGDLQKAERISKRAIESERLHRKSAAFTNLCIISTMKREFESATEYCNEAVERGGGNVAYNNRGVLRFMQGDYEGAFQDLRHASRLLCSAGCDPSDGDQRDWPSSVAKRNLGRATEQYAAIIQQQEDVVQTARADK